MAVAVLEPPPQTRRLSAAVLRWDPGCGAPIRIGIIADRRLSVAALTALLQQATGFDILHSTEGAREVRRTVASLQPGILIVDSAREARLAIDAADWGGRILLLVDPEESAAALAEAARSGAHGYLALTASRDALVLALKTLRREGSYLDPALGWRMLGACRDIAAAPEDREPLSRREREIVVQVARGRSSKEIARKYDITSKTVCNHIINVYRKLNLRHRGQLVLYAAQQGLTNIDGIAPSPYAGERGGGG
jgi:two-component system nitrate/nitrite response regulator NarL